jgi:hypothetical protein
MLKGIFEHVDELCSNAIQCENKSKLKLKYIEHSTSVTMLIMNMIYAYYVLNEELFTVAIYV